MAKRKNEVPSAYIARIHASGNPATEYVEIANRGHGPADLSLWSLHSSGGHKITFPDGLVLWPAQRITVYTGKVDPQTGGSAFDSTSAVWPEDGGAAHLHRTDGERVASYRYAGRQPGVAITHVEWDGDEYVQLDNFDSHAVDLSGWRLEAEGSRTFTFPAGSSIQPHAQALVYTNRSEPETGGYSFGSKQPVWRNTGSIARLRDSSGTLQSLLAYGGTTTDDVAPVAIIAGLSRTPSAKQPAGPKAILIGLNYADSPLAMLRGAQQDLIDMYGLLTRELGYDPRNVSVLTDDPTTALTLQKPFIAPTCESVEALLRGWSDRADDDDSLFLHFSGHGMQVTDESGDEADGLDEALLLSDRPMIDDRLLEVLTGSLAHDPRVFALVDSCHCGTVLDLTHTASASGQIDSSSRRQSHRGLVTCLAASDDAEEAADARSAEGFVGVLSYAFRKVLRANPQSLTYRGLLAGVSEMLSRGKLAQSPKLSFNVDGFDLDQPLPFQYTGPVEPIRESDMVFSDVSARSCYPQQCCCRPPWGGCGGSYPPPPPPCTSRPYFSSCYRGCGCCGRY
ncbi:MAG: lamin tail domain-containing protein [Myxococcales bacterium]|nr:lamin tail domain-containing protein [Myxococcales bacterium]